MRLGVLGTAAITRWALLGPARSISGIQVDAIASRDPIRAAGYASRHGIPRIHKTYLELVRDPEIDAVYIPLPTVLHAYWSMQALRAGKNVLCEKPLAANAAQARILGEEARSHGIVLMEAMHYRYHPLVVRLAEIMRERQLGSPLHVEATFYSPSLLRASFRTDYELGGGAMMDLGCYPLSLVRLLAGAEPQVSSARASLLSAQVDRAMISEMVFPNGCTARVRCSMLSAKLWSARAEVRAEKGTLSICNPFHPYLYNRLRIRSNHGNWSEHVRGRSTYYYQLLAFRNAAVHGERVITDAVEAEKNLNGIDSIYQKAGLQVRGLGANFEEVNG